MGNGKRGFWGGGDGMGRYEVIYGGIIGGKRGGGKGVGC